VAGAPLLSLLGSFLRGDFSTGLDLVVPPNKKYARYNQLSTQALSRLRSGQQQPTNADDHD
jgi:hypothetical protein